MAGRRVIEQACAARDHTGVGWRHLSAKGRCLQGLLKWTGLLGRGVRNALTPRLVRAEFRLSRLPAAFDGLTLLVLADPHFHRLQDYRMLTLDCLEGLEVDVLLLLGDLRWGHSGPLDHVYEGIRHILREVHVKEASLAVLGNHDTLAFIQPLASMRIRTLVNEHIVLTRGEERLFFAGVDDAGIHHLDALEAALSGVPRDECAILLSHAPDVGREAAALGVDLMVAGHTHGGQIRLPLLGAPHVGCRAGRRAIMGPWRIGAMQGYTSSGIGVTELPVRFNCPPEAIFLTLRGEESTG